MARARNTFAKRRREMEKKRKAEEKRERRKKKKEEPADPNEAMAELAAEDIAPEP
jgi:hypothetical protein